jgi:SEC-C motif
MMMREPSRNSSCPCGSGRKFKRCCLRVDEVTDSTFVVLGPESGPEMNPDTPEGRAGILKYKRELYERWLDEPCAVLGDVTPRRAAARPELQEDLRRELEFKERIETTIITPNARMNLDFLWEALGLSRNLG